MSRYIGANVDVPAGDIGVGAREIGYMFGQYKRICSEFDGTFTGKDPKWGGSLLRPEATGYGVVYFLREMLADARKDIKGLVCNISGSGNVAQYTAEKLIELGAIVQTLSDSNGTLVKANGFTTEDLEKVMHVKNRERGRLSAMNLAGAEYFDGEMPWAHKCDIALPCATQDEIQKPDAEKLVSNGCWCVVEGANMPSTVEAIEVYKEHNTLFGPAKAANAGGVAVSGFEMAQNSARLSWSKPEVDGKLQGVMRTIYQSCKATAEKYGELNNLQLGANIAGIRKVLDAMIEQGLA